jgi:hypothetical protein
MHTLMIVLVGREQPINLVFKDYGAALKARDRLLETVISETTDDVGHVLNIGGEIAAILLTDVQKELEAQAEVALIQAREQAKAQTRANHDPTLTFAAAGRPRGLVG